MHKQVLCLRKVESQYFLVVIANSVMYWGRSVVANSMAVIHLTCNFSCFVGVVAQQEGRIGGADLRMSERRMDNKRLGCTFILRILHCSYSSPFWLAFTITDGTKMVMKLFHCTQV